MSNTPFGPKGRAEDHTTLIAGAAIVKHRGIKRGADLKTGILATANVQILGVSADNQDNVGHGFPLYMKPGALVTGEVGAAVALDALLATNSTGMFVTATTGQNVAAYAREAATAINQLIVIEIAAHGILAP